VLEGETGRLVPPGDIQALADGLAAMAGDAAGAAAMGKAGRARVERHFSLPAMVSAYQALYDRLLAERLKTTQQG
jgi:glycosyltransferase involved in cell wall biosynthesis